MTNREMLMELKKVEPMFDKLSDVAYEIVESVFDGYCSNIDDLIVGDKIVEVLYEYDCHGEHGHELVRIPIEWFDKAAYKEMKQREREAERKRKAATKKAAVARKAKKEYETYLKLKQKYESKQ